MILMPILANVSAAIEARVGLVLMRPGIHEEGTLINSPCRPRGHGKVVIEERTKLLEDWTNGTGHETTTPVTFDDGDILRLIYFRWGLTRVRGVEFNELDQKCQFLIDQRTKMAAALVIDFFRLCSVVDGV